MILYHGTTKVFDKFDLSKAGKRDSGNLGRGVYLSEDATFAYRYAEDNAKRQGGTPVVLKVRASIRKVADFYKMMPRMKYELGVQFPPRGNDTKRSDILREWFLSQGYDAAEGGNEIVVFDPKRLKILGPVHVPSERDRMRAILKRFEETGESINETEMFGRVGRVRMAKEIAAVCLSPQGPLALSPDYGYKETYDNKTTSAQCDRSE